MWYLGMSKQDRSDYADLLAGRVRDEMFHDENGHDRRYADEEEE